METQNARDKYNDFIDSLTDEEAYGIIRLMNFIIKNGTAEFLKNIREEKND